MASGKKKRGRKTVFTGFNFALNGENASSWYQWVLTHEDFTN